MTSIDFTPVLQAVVSVAGIVLVPLVWWVLAKIAQKIGIEKNAAAMQSLNDVANKSIQAAVMATQDLITEKGYGHSSVQNEQIAFAANYIAAKFKDTLAQSGLDPSTLAGRAAITDLVTRALPAGVATAAASPTTPPVAPDPPVSVVITPPPEEHPALTAMLAERAVGLQGLTRCPKPAPQP